jgi:hypothetical protein
VSRLLGSAPQTAIGDAGFSVASVFERCTTNGTAPVFPWRGTGRPRHDHETHDRHGIPRCRHCGGPTEFERFSANQGKPRLWFRCMIGSTPACTKTQTISCSTDWRSLIPLWRDEPLYHELKESHEHYEAAHDWWRDRFKVGSDTLANRPKIVSINQRRLRANVALLIEWFRVLVHHGWLGSPRRNHEEPERKQRAWREGRRAARTLARFRARVGIATPYGPAAVRLGLGEELPPSRRPPPEAGGRGP